MGYIDRLDGCLCFIHSLVIRGVRLEDGSPEGQLADPGEQIWRRIGPGHVHGADIVRRRVQVDTGHRACRIESVDGVEVERHVALKERLGYLRNTADGGRPDSQPSVFVTQILQLDRVVLEDGLRRQCHRPVA